jgi:hypothetical protein
MYFSWRKKNTKRNIRCKLLAKNSTLRYAYPSILVREMNLLSRSTGELRTAFPHLLQQIIYNMAYVEFF